jgi:hypothetical protein
MSIHSEHGKKAPKVLQGMMQSQAQKTSLPKGFTRSFEGNQVTISNGDKSVTTGLCHQIGVVAAINTFFQP